jgi:inner membrane protease subunit 1
MWKLVRRTLYALCVMDMISQEIWDVRTCLGPSMLPTFHSYGDVTLLEKRSVRQFKLRQGDVVVASLPYDPDKLICKRLIGLPGDIVCVDPINVDRCVFIVIPPGHVWLQGDNASNSTDSRTYGPIPYGLIRARVIARIWPLTRMEWVHNGFDDFERMLTKNVAS